MEKNKNKIKILCCYHKKDRLFKNDIVVPIHVGRAIAKEQSKDGTLSEKDYQWMLKNMIGDDTGDNISHLNRKFCELTAIYWAWKNYDKLGNPDYIGLMHYRRLFNFSDKCSFKNNYWLLKQLKITPKDIPLTEDTIIMPKIFDSSKNLNMWNFNIYNEQYKLSENYYPELFKQLQNFNKTHLNYFTNMFIMPKKIFFDYCNTLFSLCFNLLLEYNINDLKNRYFGYSCEYLTSFYVLSLVNKYKIIEYPVFTIHNNFDDYKITISGLVEKINKSTLIQTLKKLIMIIKML
ncbi:MAG: DUF4422 domain-containing protein [Candidatus Gastranaerophilaceae bacterium]